MNHVRRRWPAVLVLLVASSVSACTDQDVTASADEPALAEFPRDRWVDLPRSQRSSGSADATGQIRARGRSRRVGPRVVHGRPCRGHDDGVIRPVIDSRYRLADIAVAHEHLAESTSVGKVLIDVT